jgi:multiple sugar transport system ATP-binding protein
MIYVTHDPAEALALGDRIVVLDRGTVQGTGTPQAMYDSPPNRFVAGFLGWPPMNFVDGALRREGTGLKFEGRGWSLPVEISRHPPTGKQAGTRVTLGIRPDDILLTKPGGTGLTLKMEIALVESAGSATLVSLRRDGWQVTARIEATAGRELVREGRTVDVMLNLDRGYWFDSETGQALAKGRSTA